MCSRSTPSHYSNLPWNVRPLEYQTYHKKKRKNLDGCRWIVHPNLWGPTWLSHHGAPPSSLPPPHTPLLTWTIHPPNGPQCPRHIFPPLLSSWIAYPISIYIYIYHLSFSLFILFIYLLFLINLKIIKKKENALLTCWHICSASKIKKNYPIEALQGNTGVEPAIISHFRVVFPPLVFFLSPHFHFHFHSLSATSSILYFNLGSGLGFWLLFLIAYGSLMEQLPYLGFHLCC